MARNKTVVTVISKISERPTTRQAMLVLLDGADIIGRRYELTRASTIIGRSSKCDVHIEQDSISRNHAKILCTERGAITVEDMGSTNGTFVNDEPVTAPHKLTNGDFIKIGRAIFKFIAGGNIEAKYHEEVFKLTTTDALTQVFNKRYFLEALEREFSRCRRYGPALSLVMMDVDRFKQVNDDHGHLAGDMVLKRLAGVIQANIRREDVFARYGGEEFALILPEIDLKGAVAAAEKVRKLIEKERFTFDEQQIPVTVSAGVAQLSDQYENAEALTKAADARLYVAKDTGRNRVCF